MNDATQTPESEQDDDKLETGPGAEKSELDTLRDENTALRDQVLRALAETENVRKRAERDVANERVYAIEKFSRDLLSVSDNMSRALMAMTDEAKAALSEHGKQLFDGIEMTQKELHAALARNGVTAIDSAPGTAFDPNLHQAVTQIPSDQPAGSVAAVMQNGWMIKDRVLRAAMVAVSAGPAQAAPDAASETPEGGEA